jgi:hypothetical protein
MTNDSIEFCNRPSRSNPLTPNIESQLQCLFAWIWKATHAFLNHPLGLNIPPIPWDDRRAFTSLAAAVMARSSSAWCEGLRCPPSSDHGRVPE